MPSHFLSQQSMCVVTASTRVIMVLVSAGWVVELYGQTGRRRIAGWLRMEHLWLSPGWSSHSARWNRRRCGAQCRATDRRICVLICRFGHPLCAWGGGTRSAGARIATRELRARARANSAALPAGGGPYSGHEAIRLGTPKRLQQDAHCLRLSLPRGNRHDGKRRQPGWCKEMDFATRRDWNNIGRTSGRRLRRYRAHVGGWWSQTKLLWAPRW